MVLFSYLLDITGKDPFESSSLIDDLVYESVFAGLLGGLYVWFGWRLGATGWRSAAALVLVIANAALFLWLRNKGTRRFEELS